ncbi:pilin [Patescibacteria group bacterium]|nr:pilin [Patescibacteria group bacterium]
MTSHRKKTVILLFTIFLLFIPLISKAGVCCYHRETGKPVAVVSELTPWLCDKFGYNYVEGVVADNVANCPDNPLIPEQCRDLPEGANIIECLKKNTTAKSAVVTRGQYCLQTPIGNLDCGVDLPNYIASLYKFLISFAAVLAVVMIMVGGVQWMMAGGSPERVSNAKTYITSALIGLILALSSFLLLQTINPRLTELAMPTLPPLDKPSSAMSAISPREQQCFEQCQAQDKGYDAELLNSSPQAECVCIETEISCSTKCEPYNDWRIVENECECGVGCCLWEQGGLVRGGELCEEELYVGNEECHLNDTRVPFPFLGSFETWNGVRIPGMCPRNNPPCVTTFLGGWGAQE